MSQIQEFNFAVNLLQVILWQYDNAPTLKSLINAKQAWYDTNETEFWTDWISNVFNLITANDFGLAVWAIILNIPLYLNVNAEPSDAPIWGFNTDATPGPLENDNTNFSGGNFSNLGDSQILTTEEQRFILRLAYFKYISRGAIPEINVFLNYLCATSPLVTDGGTAWVLEGFNMTIEYVFTFDLPFILQQVLRNLDLMPRPAGVLLRALVANNTTFGFNTNPPDLENTNQNFYNSNFGAGYF